MEMTRPSVKGWTAVVKCIVVCVCYDRCWLMLERCRRSLQYHQVSCCDHLPLTNLSGHPLESLSKHRLYARLPKQAEHYLVTDVTFLAVLSHWLSLGVCRMAFLVSVHFLSSPPLDSTGCIVFVWFVHVHVGVRPSVLLCVQFLQYALWWIFCKLLSLVHHVSQLTTGPSGWKHTEFDAVHQVVTVWFLQNLSFLLINSVTCCGSSWIRQLSPVLADVALRCSGF